MKNVLIIAAEASSCLYGERIIQEFKKRDLPVDFWGVGNQTMVQMGFDLIADAKDMAVVGISEVIEKWGPIKNAYKTILKSLDTRKPSVALLMDYPGFNLRLAKELKKRKIPVVYFISPQVWAWKKGRVNTIRETVDKMLVVFPFEKEFYDQHKVPSEFVGHPLVDEWEQSRLSPEQKLRLRLQHGLSAEDFVLGIMPGSRDGEISRHLNIQLEVAKEIVKQRPHVKPVLLVAPTQSVERIQKLLPPGLDISIRVIKDDPFTVLQLFDAALVASGTATLMVAMTGVPMVVMYRVSQFTAAVAKLFIPRQFFGLPNVIMKKQVVPEYFQSECSPEVLTSALLKYIDDISMRDKVRNDLNEVSSRLGHGGCIQKVVDVLEKTMGGLSC